MMKIDSQTLFHYVETVDLKMDGLSDAECKAVETWLESHAPAQRELEAIRDHLRLLSQHGACDAPPGFTQRCLAKIHEKPIQSVAFSFRHAAAFSIILCIFAAGYWLGGGFDSSPTFEQSFLTLSSEQDEWMARLDSLLANSSQTTLGAVHPWEYPLEKLHLSNDAIQAAFAEHKNNPVIVRGLCVAIAQNIEALEALCGYLENEGEITKREEKWLNTQPDPIQSI